MTISIPTHSHEFQESHLFVRSNFTRRFVNLNYSTQHKTNNNNKSHHSTIENTQANTANTANTANNSDQTINEATDRLEWMTNPSRWMASTFAKLAKWRWGVRCWKPQIAQHQIAFTNEEYTRRTTTPNSNLNVEKNKKNHPWKNGNNLSRKRKTRTKQNNDWLVFGEEATAMQHATAEGAAPCGVKKLKVSQCKGNVHMSWVRTAQARRVVGPQRVSLAKLKPQKYVCVCVWQANSEGKRNDAQSSGQRSEWTANKTGGCTIDRGCQTDKAHTSAQRTT